MCKMGACWTVATQPICLPIFYHSISMPADLLPLILACLLVLCISMCHTCVYGVSLSAVPAGVEPYYRPCLLVWCLIISHAFWCVVTPWATPSGVAPHHQPWPLVWCLTISHVWWSVATATNIFTSWVQIGGLLQIWCYLYRGVITSDMFAELGPKLQCFLKVKDDLSEVLIFQNATLNVE